MPTHEQQKVSEELLEKSLPNWDHWRQRGHCRLWQAAMLTLKTEPSIVVQNALKEKFPERYAEFIRRREVLNVQYGEHPMLPKMDHVRTGEKESGRYVTLTNVLAFAKDVGWKDMEHMDAGLSRRAVYSTSGNFVEVADEQDQPPKGEAYTLVRMGALLKILEKYLQPGEGPNREKLLKGSELNLSAVANEMQAVIAEAAHQRSTETIERFTVDTNRKQLGLARTKLATFF
jgi:hypothetical protein